eukprot:gene9463-12749_t
MVQCMYYLFIFFILNISISTGSLKRKSFDVPNPMENPKECGRKTVSKSAICDPDYHLSKDGKDIIEGYINGITKAQIAVAIIGEMESFGEFKTYNKELAADKFAHNLHNRWGVGSAEMQNGVLIFLSIQDRAIYISTGDKIGLVLTSSLIKSIIDNMKPFLRNADYDTAVKNCIIQIDLVLSGKGSEILKQSQGNNIVTYVIWGVFGIFFLGSAMMGYRSKLKMQGYERGTAALTKLMGEVDNLNNDNQYQSESCPICLEDFPSIKADEDNTDRVKTKVLDAKRPMKLRCGHTFCFTCLETYLRSADKNKCPICRKPVDKDDDNNAPPPSGQGLRIDQPQQPVRRFPYFQFGSSTQNPYQHTNAIGSIHNAGTSCADQFRENAIPQSHADSNQFPAFSDQAPEIRYRMNRMRYLYPDVMTTELLRSMNSAVDRGSIHDFRQSISHRTAEVNRIVTDIRRAAEESARRSGSRGSSRSWGGGGSSGGGGGGSW